MVTGGGPPGLPFGSGGAAKSRREGEGGAGSHIVDPGGPIGPRSVLFLRKYFSNLARMCLP